MPFFLSTTQMFSLFLWFCNPIHMVTSDVISTPHLQVTIYKLSFVSTFSIANFREALSQFPFFLMVFYAVNAIVWQDHHHFHQHCLCIPELWVKDYEKQDFLVPFVLNLKMQCWSMFYKLVVNFWNVASPLFLIALYSIWSLAW